MKFKGGFVVFGIIIGRGNLPFIQGPAKVKINKEYYIYFIL